MKSGLERLNIEFEDLRSSKRQLKKVAAGGVDGSQLECEVLACCREMLGGDYTEKCGLATELEEAGLNSLSAVDLAVVSGASRGSPHRICRGSER